MLARIKRFFMREQKPTVDEAKRPVPRAAFMDVAGNKSGGRHINTAISESPENPSRRGSSPISAIKIAAPGIADSPKKASSPKSTSRMTISRSPKETTNRERKQSGEAFSGHLISDFMRGGDFPEDETIDNKDCIQPTLPGQFASEDGGLHMHMGVDYQRRHSNADLRNESEPERRHSNAEIRLPSLPPRSSSHSSSTNELLQSLDTDELKSKKSFKLQIKESQLKSSSERTRQSPTGSKKT